MAQIIDLQTRQPRKIEQRRHARLSVVKGATLTFNNGFGEIEGLVRNQSVAGAKLCFWLGETLCLPAVFEVTIDGESLRRTARVRWRTTTTMGVEFR